MKITLKDILFRLAENELSNLALGFDGKPLSAPIRESRERQVTNYLNEGLNRLYTRFILKEKNVIVELVDHITHYHLDPRFALSSYKNNQFSPGITGTGEIVAKVDIPYIKDLVQEPFTGDIVKVLRVVSLAGYELPLNDLGRSNSVHTPEANVLYVPNPVSGQAIVVHYQAKHPLLKPDGLSDLVEIPDSLEEALCSYVAYKVYKAINTAEAKATGQEFFANYEYVCKDVLYADGVQTSLSQSNERFNLNGWF